MWYFALKDKGFFGIAQVLGRREAETAGNRHGRILFGIGDTARTLCGEVVRQGQKKKETRYRSRTPSGSLFPHQPKTTNLNEP